MFAGYSTAVVSYAVNERFVVEDRSKPVSSLFAGLTFVLPTMFTVLIIFVILLQAYGSTFKDFEQFKRTALMLEALFAIYIGRLIYSMFENAQQSREVVPDAQGQAPPARSA